MSTTDKELEQIAITKCVNGENALPYFIENHINEAFFVVHHVEASWVYDYWRKYGKAPTGDSLKREFPNFNRKRSDLDLDYIVDELREHYAYQYLTGQIEEASDLVVKGKSVDALIQLRQALNRAEELMPITDVDIVDQYEIVYEQLDARMQRWARGERVGILTGFPTIDDLSGGWEGGEYITVFGRPEVGKSWMLLKFAEVAFLQGCDVLYVPLEMSSQKISYRFHTLVSQALLKRPIRNRNLVKGKRVDMRKYQDLLEYLRYEYPNKFTVTNAATNKGKFTVDTLLQKVEKHEPDIVFIDYITLLDSGSSREGWEAIQETSQGIKQLTMQKNIPIIVAAQASRESVKTRTIPRLENIGYSDAIGQDSDKVFGLARMDEQTLVMACIKNRDGEKFTIKIDFDVNRGRLVEIDSWTPGAEL